MLCVTSPIAAKAAQQARRGNPNIPTVVVSDIDWWNFNRRLKLFELRAVSNRGDNEFICRDRQQNTQLIVVTGFE
jgi:hypothetical protein